MLSRRCLLCGCVSAEHLYIEDPSYYYYLSQSNCFTVPGIDDAADFREVHLLGWAGLITDSTNSVNFWKPPLMLGLSIGWLIDCIARDCTQMQDALTTIGLTDEEKWEVAKVVSAILWYTFLLPSPLQC